MFTKLVSPRGGVATPLYESGGEAEPTITMWRETTQEHRQTTTHETIVIYPAPEKWSETNRYALFEIIDVPRNVFRSTVSKGGPDRISSA